jgi:hypothetical protein
VLSLKTNLNRILHHKKAIATIWILLILFPNPMVLPVDVYRFFKMPTKPTGDVNLVAASLPANGSAIEQYVDAHVHYTYDFQAYGAVWYLPTPSDVLKSQQGDCKSKAVLTASLFEAKGIPYTLVSLLSISGSTTAESRKPTLVNTTKPLKLPSLTTANSSCQTKRMRFSI